MANSWLFVVSVVASIVLLRDNVTAQVTDEAVLPTTTSIKGQFGKNTQLTISRASNAIVYYNRLFTNSSFPVRVTVRCYNYSTLRDPTVVSVYESRSSLSWQIPLLIGRNIYYQVSRTLCPDSFELAQNKQRNVRTAVQLMSDSVGTSCSIMASEFTDYFVRVNSKRNAVITASEPIYYELQVASETATVRIDSPDRVCAHYALQILKKEQSCVIYDLEEDMPQNDLYGTFTTQATLTISRKNTQLNDRFILVIVLHRDDSPCSSDLVKTPQKFVDITESNRVKNITFSLQPVNTNYALAVWLPFGLFILFGGIFVAVEILLWRSFRNRSQAGESNEQELPATVAENRESQAEAETETETAMAITETEATNTMLPGRTRRQSASGYSACVLRETSLRHLQKRYSSFWKYVIIVSLFYLPPTAQLVASYQRYTTASGNQDVCYYNYRCAHPGANLTMSNSVWSNIGYVILGVFLFVIAAIRVRNTAAFSANGVPEVHGVSLAIGFALIAEGLLSASYHVCPNYANFQFDITFMLVLCALGYVRLHQNRHPDEITSSTMTFIVVALAMVFFVLDIIWSLSRHLVFWVIVWISAGFFTFLCATRYYNGWPKFNEVKNLLLCRFKCDGLKCCSLSFHPSRGYAKFILSCCYVAFAALYLIGCGFLVGAKKLDFGTYALGFCLCNLLLYHGFYIATKVSLLRKKKGQRWPLWYIVQLASYLVLSLIVWGFALYFFINPAYSWTYSPAGSREQNAECIFLAYYDIHDVWHFLSAMALFLTFLMTLSIDDDLLGTQRKLIYSKQAGKNNANTDLS